MDRSLVMADIPGLIEGAHAGAGLGHEFLRHVERTRVLVHLVEPEPVDGTDPIENYRAIRSELEQYGHGLADRPEIVAVSKAELPERPKCKRSWPKSSAATCSCSRPSPAKGSTACCRPPTRRCELEAAQLAAV